MKFRDLIVFGFAATSLVACGGVSPKATPSSPSNGGTPNSATQNNLSAPGNGGGVSSGSLPLPAAFLASSGTSLGASPAQALIGAWETTDGSKLLIQNPNQFILGNVSSPIQTVTFSECEDNFVLCGKIVTQEQSGADTSLRTSTFAIAKVGDDESLHFIGSDGSISVWNRVEALGVNWLFDENSPLNAASSSANISQPSSPIGTQNGNELGLTGEQPQTQVGTEQPQTQVGTEQPQTQVGTEQPQTQVGTEQLQTQTQTGSDHSSEDTGSSSAPSPTNPVLVDLSSLGPNAREAAEVIAAQHISVQTLAEQHAHLIDQAASTSDGSSSRIHSSDNKETLTKNQRKNRNRRAKIRAQKSAQTQSVSLSSEAHASDSENSTSEE